MSQHVSDRSPSKASASLRTAAVLALAGVCGWFVMELEILGGRVLTPYFGSKVYVVWGSVIGVFLLSLAGGYLLGGWVSRRQASNMALGLCVCAAGAWLCLMPFLVDRVCDPIFNISERMLPAPVRDEAGSLVAAFVLFCLPTALLATVSPTAVSWLTVQAEQAGRNTGLVFAVSTVASFAGCVTTAFYLVRFSVRRTIWASGAVLLIVGGLLLMHWALRGALTQERRTTQ